jgi:hypothetical protein
MDYRHLLSRQPRRVLMHPADLLAVAVEYFEWAENTPIAEEELFHFRGEIIRESRNKVRAFSKRGFSTYLGISYATLDSYRTRGPEWAEVLDLIEQVIYTQKFEHAAAGTLNAVLISRDLGLADRSEISGRDGSPLVVENRTTIDPTKLSTGALEELWAAVSQAGADGASAD